MNLLLIRNHLSRVCTLGDLLLGEDANGEWLCYTLEDPWHEKKVYGDTCIPEGTYKVVLSPSHRFKKIMPRLLQVPGFDGVLIHGGCTKENTMGCVLVGTQRDVDSINTSAPALAKVVQLLQEKGPHQIKIRKAENV